MSIPVNLALFFDSTGVGEWLVLGVVILIVVGPKRLPEVARKIGKTMEMFRRAADEFRRQLLTMDQEPYQPPDDPPQDFSQDESQTDEDGVPKTDDPYAEGNEGDPYANNYDADCGDNPYPDDAGYPGNEDQVKKWSSDQLSDYPDGRSPETDSTLISEEEGCPVDRADVNPSEAAERANLALEKENVQEEKKA